MSTEKAVEFHPAEGLKYDGFHCTAIIKCACDVCWIGLDAEGEPKRCDYCGRTYRLAAVVEVAEPEANSGGVA